MLNVFLQLIVYPPRTPKMDPKHCRPCQIHLKILKQTDWSQKELFHLSKDSKVKKRQHPDHPNQYRRFSSFWSSFKVQLLVNSEFHCLQNLLHRISWRHHESFNNSSSHITKNLHTPKPSPRCPPLVYFPSRSTLLISWYWRNIPGDPTSRGLMVSF